MRIRTLTALVAALALTGAACGDDATDERPQQDDAPVNTQTPANPEEGETPAPNQDDRETGEGG